MLENLELLNGIGSRWEYEYKSDSFAEILKIMAFHNEEFPIDVYDTRYVISSYDEKVVIYIARNASCD